MNDREGKSVEYELISWSCEIRQIAEDGEEGMREYNKASGPFDRLLWNLILMRLHLRPDFSVDHTLNPQSKMSEHVDTYVYVSVDSFSDWQDYTKMTTAIKI